MAENAHVDSPYHLSFSVCASGIANYGNNRGQYDAHQRGNFPQRQRSTYYDDYLKPSYDFYCDLCDRGFYNNGQLEAHFKEHVTCGLDGCKFTAHSKIVANHVRVQHATGIFNKIKKLDNPEEVKKWLEERKRKYPTSKVVLNKGKLEEAKKKRGETIERSRSGFNKDFSRRGRGPVRGRGRGRDKRNRTKRPVTVKPFIEEQETVTANGNVPAFRGIGSIIKEEILSEPEDCCNISDEEDHHPVQVKQETHSSIQVKEDNAPKNKSLGLLMAAYDSDASDDEETVVAPQPVQCKTSATQPEVGSDQEAPEEVKTVKDTLLPIVEAIVTQTRKDTSQRKRKRPEPAKPIAQRPKRPRKPTLLQKLLENEVQRDNKIIAECTRYIVKNNFFRGDKREQKKPKERTQRQKTRLLEGLLRNEIVNERNIIMQCVRHAVSHNFYQNITKI